MTARSVRHEPQDDALAALLAPWLPDRRWFPAKGTVVQATAVGGTTLTDPLHQARVRVLLVRVGTGDGSAVLQVPLTLRPPGGSDDPQAPDDLVGHLPNGTRVGDGTSDPAFLRAWLATADHPSGAVPAAMTAPPRVVPGEQSNTSVILPGAGTDGQGAMLKVFRRVADGDNPDVDVPRALAETGWPNVPRPLAWLTATWPDGTGTAEGHLAVLSELVPDAEDGFELACRTAARDESFAALAHELGVVVAQMHQALRTALPVTDESDDGDAVAHLVADALTDRFRWASGVVDSLRTRSGQVQTLADRVRALTSLPARQRVHGDLHLGQVLRARSTWYVLDFEGEPLRPLAERTRPDLALRDAAGMLRSFDYAAAVGGAGEDWARESGTAFRAGYATGPSGTDTAQDALLLRALELDKALYETVYEARNRPAWLPIPLHAVDRLLA